MLQIKRQARLIRRVCMKFLSSAYPLTTTAWLSWCLPLTFLSSSDLFRPVQVMSLSPSARKRKMRDVKHEILSMKKRNAILLILAGIIFCQFVLWPIISQSSTSTSSTIGAFKKSSTAEACRDVVDTQRAMLNTHFGSAFRGVQSVALIGYRASINSKALLSS